MKGILKGIYQETRKVEAPDHFDFYLKLEEDYLGMLLRAVDKDGGCLPCAALLRIHKDGTMTRCGSVNKDLGLPLDEAGRVKIS